ncbi:MAG: APC family permease [Clostridiales Family XIII bacterium]|jgi:amino acid transporter|nr:APC family permease [Clostridiales Family XIII bacterium]
MAHSDLQKTIKLSDYFMLGFGSIVGVGWAVSLNSWIGNGGGVFPALVGYAIATLIMIPIGLCYAEMTPAMPVAGGAVAFTTRAFGTLPSFIAGWFIVLAYINILPWEAIYINDVLGLIFPVLKSGEPLYVLGGAGIYPKAIVVGIILSCAVIAVNWVGANVAVKIQTFCTTLILIAGVFVIVFGLLKANPANFLPVHADILGKGQAGFGGGLLAVLAMAPFFLAGFDTIPQGAEEGSSGLNFKNLGKVLLGSVLSAGLFYCIIIASVGGAMPWTEFAGLERPAVSLMFQQLYPGAFGTFMYWLTMTGALAGLFTTWNGFFIAGARLILGMSRARLLPAFFSRIHPKYGTPVGGNVLCAVATFAGPFIGIGLIDPLTIIGSSAFIIGWLFTALSCWKLRVSEPEMNRPFKMPGGTFTAILAVIISSVLFLITVIPSSPGYMGNVGMAYLVGWIVLGTLLYIGSGGYRNSISAEQRVKYLFMSMKAESADN